MKQALLVVDVQNYFINKNTQHIPNNIKRLIQANDFSVIAFSQFINQPDSSFIKYLNFTGCTKSPYSDIVNELRPWLKKDNIFTKCAFSVFVNPDFENYFSLTEWDFQFIINSSTADELNNTFFKVSTTSFPKEKSKHFVL